jgi:hypothetical protein
MLCSKFLFVTKIKQYSFRNLPEQFSKDREKTASCNEITILPVAMISDSSKTGKEKKSFAASLHLTQKINWYSISINIVCKLLTSTP